MLNLTRTFVLLTCTVCCTVGNAQQPPSASQQHKIILRDVGEWTFHGKMLTAEGFQDFKGKETVRAIGEFWTVSQYKSDIFGGMKGSTTIGYDASKEEFVGTWADSIQPSVTRMTGDIRYKKSDHEF